MKRVVVLCLLLFALPSVASDRAIAPSEAYKHVGQYGRVCGYVASTKFAYRSRGAPTFLNLDAPYPNQMFTALIWIEDRAKFGRPEVRFAGKQICVGGLIQSYRGTPEIIVRNPSQVETSNE